MNFDVKKNYAKYRPEIRDYMQLVVDNLLEHNGKIDPSYKIGLDLMAMNLELMLRAMDDIMKEGLEQKDYNNRVVKNRSLQVFNTAQSYLIKLINQFGCTPNGKKKLKMFIPESPSGGEDPIDDWA